MTQQVDPKTVEVSRLPSSGSTPPPKKKLWPRLLSAAVVAATVAVSGTVAYRELWVQPSGDKEESDASGNGSEFTVYDEFDAARGSALDSSKWSYDTGRTGWGNNEKQDYTDSTDNSAQDGSGNLDISALDAAGGYTSARVTTKDKFEFTYGRVEARIKMPAGQGLHPAFWLLGTDIDSVGWPISGEIDVIETLNAADNYHSGIHAPEADSLNSQKSGTSGIPIEPLSEDFHTYWVERSPDKVVTGMDETVLSTITPADLTGGDEYWVFDKPFYLLFNVAVAGDWPGPTTAQTKFPATMSIDWVRYRTD
ncbi:MULTISPECIES: glycoside hydrolase family 16 protein [unclassified Rhodococcus (in: high G+C Gram-positive bacteria)]|uniref:glycoside hydrolase family 16 protein n=1 Tax=unclassified Rhodococcus (in: high G+C Gram-positive bacteria) TaxID=192944 RepID=UPI000A011110|nr:glycoside hydrolase family 16 protein [Rhodococcus sp. 1163]